MTKRCGTPLSLRSSSKKPKKETPDPWRIGDILCNECGPNYDDNDHDGLPRFLEVTPTGMVRMRGLHWKAAGLPDPGAVLPDFYDEAWMISSTLRIVPDGSGICTGCSNQSTPGGKFRFKIIRRASDNRPLLQ